MPPCVALSGRGHGGRESSSCCYSAGIQAIGVTCAQLGESSYSFKLALLTISRPTYNTLHTYRIHHKFREYGYKSGKLVKAVFLVKREWEWSFFGVAS